MNKMGQRIIIMVVILDTCNMGVEIKTVLA